MSEMELTSRAAKHWKRWLPEKTAQLKAEGQFLEATQTAGKLAQARINQLMLQGFKSHEAEEVALAEYVLLKPEAKASNLDWETQELAQKEAAYQKMMREPM